MSNFFGSNVLGAKYDVVLVSRLKSDPSAFIIEDQGGFIPTHEDIEEFISGLRQTYSCFSKEDVSFHNQKILDDMFELKQDRACTVKTKAAPRKGFVYLIKANDSNRYKIGFSIKPLERVKALQKTCPFPLAIFHSIPTNDMVGVERYFHSMFDQYRVNGEWFDLPSDAIEYFTSYTEIDYKVAS